MRGSVASFRILLSFSRIDCQGTGHIRHAEVVAYHLDILPRKGDDGYTAAQVERRLQGLFLPHLCIKSPFCALEARQMFSFSFNSPRNVLWHPSNLLLSSPLARCGRRHSNRIVLDEAYSCCVTQTLPRRCSLLKKAAPKLHSSYSSSTMVSQGKGRNRGYCSFVHNPLPLVELIEFFHVKLSSTVVALQM